MEFVLTVTQTCCNGGQLCNLWEHLHADKIMEISDRGHKCYAEITDRMTPRYVYHKPQMVKFPDKYEKTQWVYTIYYEVCSNSIQIGTVVVVHWVGCVCNQSRHVRTCLSNS